MKPQDTLDKIRTRHSEFESLRSKLTQRVNSVRAALEGCNIRSEQLNTQELVELMYQNYNPALSREQKVEDYTRTDII